MASYFDGQKKQIAEIIRKLSALYPGAKTALIYRTPFELLVATILSAQCTDIRVNRVTKELFRKYKTMGDFAKVSQTELEKDIHSTGFYRNKAKNIIASAKMLIEKYNSKVPETMDELITLPGVARKTANVVLSEAYNKVEGMAVDTHVARLSQRLCLSRESDPNKIEKDLMSLVPKESWHDISNLLILHGRKICAAKKPLCSACVLNSLCPSAFRIPGHR